MRFNICYFGRGGGNPKNPTKAVIIKGIEQYPWSSYQENTTKLQVCDIVFALKIFSEDYQKALELFSEEPLNHS